MSRVRITSAATKYRLVLSELKDKHVHNKRPGAISELGDQCGMRSKGDNALRYCKTRLADRAIIFYIDIGGSSRAMALLHKATIAPAF